MTFFPFETYWWLYLSFVAFVFLMLALDLGVFHKKVHEVSVKEATIWTVVWITSALVFNLLFFYYSNYKFENISNFYELYGVTPYDKSKQLGLEFLTGFIVEKTLAIDNIFVFAIVFSYFAIPKMYQHRILFWGIIGALIFRGLFIAVGTYLMQYKFIVIIFGVLLILTGIKMLVKKEEENISENFIIKWAKKFLNIHPKIEGQNFVIMKNGKRFVTPLFMALLFIEVTDIIFAVDSVPAIFSITKEPFIVFTSNIFAILGLRSMYFMLIGVLDKFKLIKYGLAGVLVFVGLKMVYLNELFDGKFPVTWSLAIIATIILSSVLASLVYDKKADPSVTRV